MKNSVKSFFQGNAIVHLAGVMWHYARGKRGQVVLYVTMAAGAVLLGLLAPLVMAELMSAIQDLAGEELLGETKLLLAAYVAIGVGFWLLHGPSQVLQHLLAFRVRQRLQTALFHKVTKLPMRWHRDHHSGKTIDQVRKATEALEGFTMCSFEVIHVLTRFFGAVAVLAWMMPLAGGAALFMGGLAVLVIVLFDRKLIVRFDHLNKEFNGVAAEVQDYLTNVSTVISLRLEDRVGREVHERMGTIRPAWKGASILGELKWFTTARVVDLTRAGIIFGYVFLAVRAGRKIEIGTMYALNAYLQSIGESFFQFTYMYGELVRRSRYVRAVEHIEQDFAELVRPSEKASLPKVWQKVRIESLCFSHAEKADRGAGVSLDSMSLERGKSYAFVGPSGSGKSTLLGLIRGIYEESQAKVYCDERRLPHGLVHIAHKTTLIPQDPEIFSKSIAFNITLGVEAKAEAVERAVELACFEEVLRELPRGLETSIAEKGVSLSGGQRQRLALARGLFFAAEGESDFILLDEPTSSVDAENEWRIYSELLRSFDDRCVISAVHKLHLLPLFDEVVVFAAGRMVEQGPVEELTHSGGRLAELVGNFGGKNSPEAALTA